MTTPFVPMLSDMAEAEAVELVSPGTDGAVECQAPGCHNWFVKRSGRHVYCKTATCTYRRGAPPAPELVSPEGAAEELLRRLQEVEVEPGPALLVERVRAVGGALQANDPDAVWGACIDVGTAAVAMADRAKAGDLPVGGRLPGRAAVASTTQRPVGLAHAAISSHRRTYALGDQRVELIYALMTQRDQVASTELALEQTQGSPAEEEAREHYRAAKAQQDAIERALSSVEAAWRERGQSLRELEAAADAGAPENGNGRRLPVHA